MDQKWRKSIWNQQGSFWDESVLLCLFLDDMCMHKMIPHELLNCESYVTAFVENGHRLAAAISCTNELRFYRAVRNSQEKWKRAAIVPNAHSDMITDIAWAPLDFGHLCASASIDGTVCIWCERRHQSRRKPGGDDKYDFLWIRMAEFREAESAVRSVDFSDISMVSIRVATAAADGKIRVYSSMDVLSLDKWYMIANRKLLTLSRHKEQARN
eukprot:GHVO01056811.1.p1 GENE.GHVO01056811.1~~GHVO01056811.1.p1  ORF type:complete len:213 (+),score=24.79 GHVO01056811.1:365-1003(+)